MTNQTNQNSDGPAKTSSRLSTNHTIKQPDQLKRVFHAVTNNMILQWVFARATETELARSPASFTYGMDARDFHRPARWIFNSEIPCL